VIDERAGARAGFYQAHPVSYVVAELEGAGDDTAPARLLAFEHLFVTVVSVRPSRLVGGLS
jgi:hypothetical protein